MTQSSNQTGAQYDRKSYLQQSMQAKGSNGSDIREIEYCHNYSDAGDVESGPSNLDAEQEEELMISEPRRLTRRSSPVTRLEPSMMGKSYLQESTRAKGSNGSDIREIEYCHNLIAQVHPNPNEDVEYKNTHAMLIARCMDDINNRVTTRGASFAQQFLLHKGLKVFGEHGHEAATKEMDQLH